MKQLSALVKKVRLRQILTLFLAGVLLVISTACNSGDIRGARPDNPPVQAGGMNNPHKGGGDNYTNYKATTDSRVVNPEKNRADLQIVSHQLVAFNNESELLYPGAETLPGRIQKEKELPKITEKDAEFLLGDRQPVINPGAPEAKIPERAGQAFEEATRYLKEKAEEAGARPETQPDPRFQK